MSRGEAAARQETAAPLRILIDARKIWDGGIGVYTRNLLAGLAARGDAAVTALLPPGVGPRLGEYEWSGRVKTIEDAARPYSLDEMLRLGRRMNTAAFDVYHAPHYILPYGIRIPAVVTVHDLIHVTHPQHFYYPPVAKFLMHSALRRAARVLAVSQATRDDLERLWGGRDGIAAKLRVVPNALDPFFLGRFEAGGYLRSRFNLSGPYLLGVFSMFKPHKGLRDLVRAFAAVRAAREGLKLVLVGRGVEHPGARALLHGAGIEEIMALGFVEREDLARLHAGAEALVVASLAEGFFLPALEAQAQGTSVIARPVAAIRELLCEQDICCRDFSQEALEEGLREFLERRSDKTSAARRPAERGHLAAFGRDRVAGEVMNVYREVCS